MFAQFLIDDARLFEAIVTDLFPSAIAPASCGGDVAAAAACAARALSLQPTPPFLTKVVQLHETFNVRFGVMLVGPTGGGKSAAAAALRRARTDLREAGHPDPAHQVTHLWAVNPKSVKMGELYGEYNQLTNEWQDGIASSLIRAAVADASPHHHWVCVHALPHVA
eukprot:352906-Chlamydomonas_euryale.AAC.2